ncbi:MAG: ion transporter [bacterium]|nr:ion transporter [bacterium]
MVEKRFLREKIRRIIYESDTVPGLLFDILLIVSILLSVLFVILESVHSIALVHGHFLRTAEWVFTVLFTIEYFLRIISIGRPLRYIFSFFGFVDLISILPTYLSLFFPGMQALAVFRILRFLRMFRLFKLRRYVSASNILIKALKASKQKIIVFLFTVFLLIIIMGSLMYVIEGPENGFTDILTSMYWAVVTITTVGFGDIVPVTALGKSISAILMIIGYGIIAVPTGIVSAELIKSNTNNARRCFSCSFSRNDSDALYCKRCGKKLNAK